MVRIVLNRTFCNFCEPPALLLKTVAEMCFCPCLHPCVFTHMFWKSLCASAGDYLRNIFFQLRFRKPCFCFLFRRLCWKKNNIHGVKVANKVIHDCTSKAKVANKVTHDCGSLFRHSWLPRTSCRVGHLWATCSEQVFHLPRCLFVCFVQFGVFFYPSQALR